MAFNILILVYASLGLLAIWLPYRWPAIGDSVRKSSGPWLVNFNPRQRRLCYLRDGLYTVGGICMIVGIGGIPEIDIAFIVGVILIFSPAVWIEPRLEGSPEGSVCAAEVVASRDITYEDIRAFLPSSGVVAGGRRQAYLGRGEHSQGFFWIKVGHIAVYGDDAYIAELDSDDQEAAREQSRQVMDILHETAETLFYLNIPRKGVAEDGELALMRFVCATQQRWPCVVISNGRVISGQEVCRACEDEKPILGLASIHFRGNP